MEKRFLLAFLLSLAVLVMTQIFVEKKMKPPSTTPPVTATPAPASPAPTPMAASKSEAAASPSPALENIKGANEHDIVLENTRARIVLTNRGGVVKSWLLKDYKDSNHAPLDLVAGLDPQTQRASLPLQLNFPDDSALEGQVQSALFADSLERGPGGETRLTLRYASGNVSIEKDLTVDPQSYINRLEVRVTRGGMEMPFLVAWPSKFGDNALDIHTDLRQIVTAVPGKIDRTSLAKVKGTPETSGGFRFAGIEDRYFAAVFLPENSTVSRVRYTTEAGFFSIPTGPTRLFVGPKEVSLLRQVDPQLEAVVDFGWFGIIGKPLFMALKWIYVYCKNYGGAIILLTLVINMALFPLRWKSMVSAQKMQKIQPRIKAIQEKYKKYKVNDPKRQEMNQEMMGLYKEHGVNPLGGCLPLVLQMPILVAFYNVLNSAIDLRQVGFLWIPDLSQHDRTFVLVIIMVITQFISQKLTPAPSTDPTQAKMFLIMPLVFGVMFAKVASGLVLYWLTGNLIGIIQQLFLNRYSAAHPAVARKDLKGK
ncbi:MAG: membrane protein insertase YidC [Acidobacteriia bacterium]|nr:membrane protein insertase YidC [Terriglobia bacterium]